MGRQHGELRQGQGQLAIEGLCGQGQPEIAAERRGRAGEGQVLDLEAAVGLEGRLRAQPRLGAEQLGGAGRQTGKILGSAGQADLDPARALADAEIGGELRPAIETLAEGRGERRERRRLERDVGAAGKGRRIEPARGAQLQVLGAGRQLAERQRAVRRAREREVPAQVLRGQRQVGGQPQAREAAAPRNLHRSGLRHPEVERALQPLRRDLVDARRVDRERQAAVRRHEGAARDQMRAQRAGERRLDQHSERRQLGHLQVGRGRELAPLEIEVGPAAEIAARGLRPQILHAQPLGRRLGDREGEAEALAQEACQRRGQQPRRRPQAAVQADRRLRGECYLEPGIGLRQPLGIELEIAFPGVERTGTGQAQGEVAGVRPAAQPGQEAAFLGRVEPQIEGGRIEAQAGI